MIRFLVIGLLLTLPYFSKAQIIVRGIVIDSANHTPIPYAGVLTDSKKNGTIADETGMFEMEIPDSEKVEFIIFTSIGYDTSKIKVDEFINEKEVSVFLTRRPAIMPEVVISDNSSFCLAIWGAKKNRSHGGFYSQYGTEIAVFIANPNRDSGVVSKLNFYVCNDGIPITNFRAKLYEIDSVSKGPGRLINTDDLILHAQSGNSWAVIDISRYKIQIPRNGFFVAMEWLPEAKSNTFKTKISKYSYSAHGQVLGGNKEIKTAVTWSRVLLGDWKHIPSSNGFNAMIGAEVHFVCK